MHPDLRCGLADPKLLRHLLDAHPIDVSQCDCGSVLLRQPSQRCLQRLHLDTCSCRGLDGSRRWKLRQDIVLRTRLVTLPTPAAAVLGQGRVAGDPIQPRLKHGVSPEPMKTSPCLQIRVLRSLGGILRISQDAETQRIDVPVRCLDQLGPRSLVTVLATFDDLCGDTFGRRSVPVIAWTPHVGRGYRGPSDVVAQGASPRAASSRTRRSIRDETAAGLCPARPHAAHAAPRWKTSAGLLSSSRARRRRTAS